ncbi:hypothetical protein KIW84_071518 [Lathyrus oleraceus]|uniref:RRM domain-containing protein n=1 Tax=Pisum sativum TaxID=3888 RepID=A0A9D4VJN6_PEA|nr:hypothetical protein KIW84_071518 [Pisum sativum]
MYKLFEEFGMIDEVVIPPKRDKRGRKYKFVCFFNVGNVRRLVLQLYNLIIEGRKFFANIPRFHCALEGVFPPDAAKGKKTDDVDNAIIPHRAQEVSFEVMKEEMIRFEKTFIEKVLVMGATYNMQRTFQYEGYFSLKVTPLGANLFLLEENEEGELEALVEGVKDWLG